MIYNEAVNGERFGLGFSARGWYRFSYGFTGATNSQFSFVATDPGLIDWLVDDCYVVPASGVIGNPPFSISIL